MIALAKNMKEDDIKGTFFQKIYQKKDCIIRIQGLLKSKRSIRMTMSCMVKYSNASPGIKKKCIYFKFSQQ